jgi:hypothetical protein
LLVEHQKLLNQTIEQLGTGVLTPGQRDALAAEASLTYLWGDKTLTEGWACSSLGLSAGERCSFGVASAEETWLIIGDSNADMWTPTLRRIVQLNPAIRVERWIFGQCNNSNAPETFMADSKVGKEACLEFHNEAVKEIGVLRPNVLILSDAAPGSGTKEYKDSAIDFLRMLIDEASPETVAILANRPAQRAISNCLNRALSNASKCATTRSSSRDTTLLKQAIAKDAGAYFIEVRDLLCAESICPAFIGDNVVSYDGAHLAPYAAASLAEPFLEMVRRS